jgi:hypothetical protein
MHIAKIDPQMRSGILTIIRALICREQNERIYPKMFFWINLTD